MSSPSVSSSDWTTVGRDGRAVRPTFFTPQASAAFGRRERTEYTGRSDYRAERSAAGSYVPPSMRKASAPAPAPAPKVEEMPAPSSKMYARSFPSLSGSTDPDEKSEAPAPPPAKTFASLVKKAAEEEAAAEALRAYEAQKRAEERESAEWERRLHSSFSRPYMYSQKYDDEDAGYAEGGYGGDDDLDYDAYGARATTYGGEVSDVHPEDNNDNYNDDEYGHENSW